MTEKTENLLSWLRDAHAMEQQAEQMLTAQKGRLENYPKLRTRIEKHIEKPRARRPCWKRRCSAWAPNPPRSRTSAAS